MKKVVISNDHGAVELSKQLAEHLKERGYEVNHLGVMRMTRSIIPTWRTSRALNS
jgi:ribose 5-phosphate isomerase RpiB